MYWLGHFRIVAIKQKSVSKTYHFRFRILIYKVEQLNSRKFSMLKDFLRLFYDCTREVLHTGRKIQYIIVNSYPAVTYEIRSSHVKI